MRLDLRILQSIMVFCLLLLLATTATASTTNSKTSKPSNSQKSYSGTKSAKSSSKYKGKKSAKAKSHGQQGIDSARTMQIQEALIREHYLSGEPSGAWDQLTKDALAHYQEANGWQTKSLPDSRALIKLGLGPDKKGLLNPDTAVMKSPHELGTSADGQQGGFSQQ